MFLKRLELQGFKTFASRTEFEFGSGITAIIGPNGSGKSNIADAMRWVLGEQSGRLLRTKKAEDVIFAGSSLRVPAGTAEVTLTFDNSSGWLPLDFSEITIGRRIYRTGESEYYINRGKVRLKDVVELLLRANVGQNTYTVIGQGLIDFTLSLRPEERRGLIEEAADIKRYYAKIAEAQTKLDATCQNLARAQDIVAEIGPRLGRLQKQASQAAEYDRLTSELSTLLAAWYYQSWQKAMESLLAAREVATRCEHDLGKSQEELSRLAASIDEVRELRNVRRAEVVSWQKDQTVIAGRLDRVSRQLAVDSERLAAWSRQQRELADEIESLDASISVEAEALAGAKERLAALGRDSEHELSQLALVQAELEQQNSNQAELQARLSRLQEQSLAAAAALSDVQNRLAQLAERDAKLANEVQRLKAEEERLEAAVDVQLGTLRGLQGKLEACEQDMAALAAERDRRIVARRETGERIRGLEAELGETQRERARLQSQLDTLSKLQDSHSGLYAGVRTVLQAAKVGQVSLARKGDRLAAPTTSSARISGVVGIVASLVDVPQHLEVAVEVALGGHLQDIVVEKWADAERAIELLKATKGGRATFLPLDTVKGGRLAVAPNLPGLIGVASELVKHDQRLRSVVRHLLGQTVVVEDLGVARKLLGALASVGQIVTLAGEIVRPNGSLTGGATRLQAEGTMLARQRELRELPEQIRRVALRQGEVEKKLELERTGERRMGAELVDMENKERQLGSMRQSLESEMAKLQRELDRLRQEAEWQKDLGRQVEAERAEVEGRRQELAAKLVEAGKASENSRSNLADLQRAAEELLEARAGVQERFNELRTRLAVMERARESEKALMANHELLLRRLEAQSEAKRERLEALTLEGSQVESEVEFLRKEKADLERQLEALEACIEPAIARLAEMDTEESTLLGKESELKSKVLEAERRLVQANAAVQRCGEDLMNLRERMEGEGIELPVDATIFFEHPDLASQPWQLSMSLQSGATAASPAASSLQLLVDEGDGARDAGREGQLRPEVSVQAATDPVVLKRRIDRLRGQLRNLGPVSPSAIDEYDEAKKRYEFLQAQIRDLTESEKSLQEGIVVLEVQARKQFDAVFETVGREFKRFFTQLFDGGTAKLVRSDEGDGGVGGVDIVAQPPGKRLQNLSSLSGGERALTATALLFAILEVNPTPFCVLDEGDAALDEANINRFATTLRQLAKRTQFIVITHNRGTVELADTLYGISMGSDGISRMVSLRMEERAEANNNGKIH